VTIEGPNGLEEYGVGPYLDRGGPSPASHQTPSTPPGEYTITAVDEDGNRVPVNGEETYTTTVKECPTSSVQTECVDDDTALVSFRAENLTGRHASPIVVDVLSGNPANPEEFTIQPEDGVATSEFEINTTGQVLVEFAFQDASETPSRLTEVSFDAGHCADAAPLADDTSASEDEGDAGDPTATPTETDTETAADSGAQESTPTESGGDGATSTDTETETTTEDTETTTEDTETATEEAETESTDTEDTQAEATASADTETEATEESTPPDAETAGAETTVDDGSTDETAS
jgi:hypothetical protein